MTDTPIPRTWLSRRFVLAAGGALVVGGAAAADRQAIELGALRFSVPRPYLFGAYSLEAAKVQGIPPNFSFAFEMPDGAPAGEGLEFPPVTHPYVLDRGNGRYLVMCYRVSPSGPDALNTPPIKGLQSNLLSTTPYDYANVDGMLSIRVKTNADVNLRYISFLNKRSNSVVQAFLSRAGTGQFFYGSAEFQKPAVTTVIYIPQEKISEATLVLQKTAELLSDWKV